MFKIYRKELMWGGRKLTLETGRIARQADGAVLATYGDTMVLCTAVGAKSPKPGVDFFPLTVNYQEKTFAAGKIPGGFFKREGRPTEKEVLTSRLIDRPIRPLFHPAYRNETQVICTVLSHDLENDPDIVALVGASAALTISGIPFMGPIGAARVGYVDGKYVLNPTAEQLANSALDLVVAGTAEGVLMVESEAKELSEEIMLGAVNFGATEYQPRDQRHHRSGRAMRQGAVAAGRGQPGEEGGLGRRCNRSSPTPLRAAYAEQSKQARTDKVDDVKKKAKEAIGGAEQSKTDLVGKLFKDLERDIVRGDIVKTGKRIDGRDSKTVRPISSEVGILPRAHGSALFTRGETQAPGGRHARHRPGRADHRRARRRIPRELHAALQLPALLDRRSGPHGLARPARDRPRQARLARDPSAAAGEGGVPLHHPHRLGDHRVATARPRWRRCAAPRLAMMDAGVPLKRRWPASPWA